MNSPSSIKHYLQFKDFSLEEYEYLPDHSAILKAKFKSYETWHPPRDRMLAMVFKKNSMRTRLPSEAGIHQPGGHAIFLNTCDSQLRRSEPVESAAQVISRMTDIIMIRTFGQEIIRRFTVHSRVPVINELTNEYHPCQVLTDIFTLTGQRSPTKGKAVTWVSDASNMACIWTQTMEILGFRFRFSMPKGYQPDSVMMADSALPFVYVFENPLETYDGAYLVTTDVWASMSYETGSEARKKAFGDWTVAETMMQRTQPDALFVHCLPARRGEGVEMAIIDGRQSVVWDEAENRLRVQRALMEYLLCGRY